MRILTKFLTISLMAVALSACGDKQENSDNQTPTPTKPSTLLSENSSMEDMAKVWVGTWATQCFQSKDFPNQSFIIQVVFEPSPNPNMVYNTKLSTSQYDNTTCDNKGKINVEEESGNEYKEGWLASTEFVGIEKGNKPHEVLGNDYLIVHRNTFQQHKGASEQTMAMNYDGNIMTTIIPNPNVNMDIQYMIFKKQ